MIVRDRISSFHPVDQVVVFVLVTDGNRWREIGNYTDRSRVDGNVKAFPPFSANQILVLGDNATLWLEQMS